MITGWPRGVSRVFACRPARPSSESEAVLQAARGRRGSVASIAREIAEAVVIAAIREIDQDPADTIISLLLALATDPVVMLATDAEIDTGSMIVAERVERLQSRGGRRAPEGEWAQEDELTRHKVGAILARRYARILRSEFCS